MMKKKLMALMALTVLTACDYANRADLGRERADGLYKSAMEDYSAGRIDAAVKSFKEVVRKDPSNASARFQLACLLQDSKSDFLGAFCAYREYLSQHPESDKSKLAKDRLAKCELELAKFLADKHGLSDKDGFVRENAALKADLQAAEARAALSEKEAESLRKRVSALSAERERLLAVVKGVQVDGVVARPAPSVKEAKDLLEEDDEDADRIKTSADAAALRLEIEQDQTTSSELLPARPVVTNVAVAAAPPKPTAEVKAIPEFHIVKEGETLYGIAKRYYGRLSAWKQIRDMNKALISADNRLHVGDKLRLPRQ